MDNPLYIVFAGYADFACLRLSLGAEILAAKVFQAALHGIAHQLIETDMFLLRRFSARVSSAGGIDACRFFSGSIVSALLGWFTISG